MSLRKDGIMIVLSSPSGAGKTTLVKLLSKKKNNSISVSFTTRKPRPNEKNKRDYFFVSKKYFKLLIKKKSFLEHAKVFNNYYGSSKELVLKKLKKGQNVIFDIDWQGAQQIQKKNLNYKLLTIFILPPSKNELFKRLLNRETGDRKVAKERMTQFKKDLQHWVDYDFVVINDDLEKCYNKIDKFIQKNKNLKKIKRFNSLFIKTHIKKLLK